MTPRLGCLVAVAVMVMGPGLVRSSLVARARAAEPAEPAGLSITGDIAQPITWTLAELKAMPRTSVTVQESGQPAVYEGVLAGELLRRAGVSVGRDLTGNVLATYVRAVATDGYEVVFSIGELDPALTSDEIIVADTVGGKPLVDQQGPLRIVAPHDKRMARSVRMLVRLEVVRLKK
jgi:DMSO/TMAO reductase YedYZ molybdopterin-dependent catalytic subunit